MAKAVDREEIVYHLADGSVTKDKNKATSAEVTVFYKDGTKESTLLRISPSGSDAR